MAQGDRIVAVWPPGTELVVVPGQGRFQSNSWAMGWANRLVPQKFIKYRDLLKLH
jgi:hypothetical protein